MFISNIAIFKNEHPCGEQLRMLRLWSSTGCLLFWSSFLFGHPLLWLLLPFLLHVFHQFFLFFSSITCILTFLLNQKTGKWYHFKPHQGQGNSGEGKLFIEGWDRDLERPVQRAWHYPLSISCPGLYILPFSSDMLSQLENPVEHSKHNVGSISICNTCYSYCLNLVLMQLPLDLG